MRGDNKKKTTPEQERIICERYIKGEAAKIIAPDYNIKELTVHRILKRNKIPTTPQYLRGRKYMSDENYFNVIDTEDKAYFLGLIYADGTVNKKGIMSISLQEDDKYILEAFRDKISPTSPIKLKPKRQENWKNQYNLIICSFSLVRKLQVMGCTYVKSRGMNFPEYISCDMMRHFIRGYFDGDGCISITKNGKCNIQITSCFTFLQGMKQELLKFGITTGKIRMDGRNKYTASLTINGKENRSRFYQFLYKDASLYLTRKYNKFKQIENEKFKINHN